MSNQLCEIMIFKKTGNRYYVDGGYINEGKSVCNWFSVRKDVLESFVLKSVKEVLLAPEVIDKVKGKVRDLLNKEPLQMQKRIQNITQMLRDHESKISNLMRLAEEGSGLKTVAARLQELEDIQEKLRDEKARLQKTYAPKSRRMDIANEVTSFLEHFESSIQNARIAERKELLRRVVDRITVDKEQKKVRCYI